ncbi:HBL/NHE enterotoxin family protein [Bacillus carboniphilus]|uniref:HBL/NHE enterotoxin family protein n=1 Tax=Bacillus carboniphilus TaxID=86663 RepID=A0ABY9JRY3_9BACI|nr:HBL/NHE enterotoxin family protein [Bacillus carboniphilus]WLR41160.1 HBL/NHE enterotoxin family protein [Bacillus carboniphilus]
MKNKIIIGTLVATLSTSSLIPMNVFAEEQPAIVKDEAETIYLSPTSLSSNLDELSGQAIIMQSYALNLLKYPTIELEQIPTLETHVDRAKDNATYWLDNIHPLVIEVNQEVIGFNNKFQNYYDLLVQLTEVQDEQSKENLLYGLTILQDDIASRKDAVENIVDNLKYFKESLQTDYNNFSNDALEAKLLLDGEEGKIEELERLLDSINADIETDVKLIVTGTVTSIAGIGLITAGSFALAAVPEGASKAGAVATIIGGVNMTVGGVVVIGYASNDLVIKQQELIQVASNLSEVESQVATLTIVKSQVDSFVENIDETISALEDIERGWIDLQNGFVDLTKKIDRDINLDSSFIQSQLSRAKESWENIATNAEKLQGANVVINQVDQPIEEEGQ